MCRGSQLALIAMVSAPLTAMVSGQSTGPDAQRAHAFDVASIKENPSEETRYAPATLPSGRFTASNHSLRSLIEYAYDVDLSVSRFVLVGGPEKILATRFDIVAVGPPVSGQDLRAESKLRLRTLLSDRFALRTHTEIRNVPVFALAVAREGKLGPQLRRSSNDCPAWRRARQQGKQVEEPRDADGSWCTSNPFAVQGAFRSRSAASIADLVKDIQFAFDRPLEDMTGLVGNFEWTLTFAPARATESSWPSIYTAMHEQLGLKLESRSFPIEVRVIDSVSMPTPN